MPFNIGRPFRLFYLLVHSSARCKTRISGTNDCRRSFLCAVAAKLGISLAEAEQPLHIIPGSYPCTEQMLLTEGTKVIMKTGRSVEQVKSF